MVVDAAGAPIPNAAVALALEAIAGTGGHVHEGSDGTPRPRGALSRTTVNTGASGVTTVTYTASNTASDIRVTGTADQSMSGTLTLEVGLNLVDVRVVPSWASTAFELQGSKTWHPVNHYGLLNMQISLYALSDEYHRQLAYFRQHPDKAPTGRLPAQLGLNDVSLQRGGRFDINQNWLPAHISHRKGYDADLDVRRVASDDALAKLIERIWQTNWKNLIKDERQSRNHFHLKLSPTNTVSPPR